MKKLTKTLIAILSAITIFGAGVMAGTNLEPISAYLNHGISVVKGGEVQTMYDEQGNVLEPITYNDSTYLPVRAIANILGHSIEWHHETQCILLDGSDVPEHLKPQAPKTDIVIPDLTVGKIDAGFLETLVDRVGNGKLELDYYVAPPGVVGVYTIVNGVWSGHPWLPFDGDDIAYTYEGVSIKTKDGSAHDEATAFENTFVDVLLDNGFTYVMEDDFGRHYIKDDMEFTVKNDSNISVSVYGRTSWMTCCVRNG